MTTDTPETSPLALGPAEFPLPFGIEADTGAPLPGLTDLDLERIDQDRKEVRERCDRGAADHLAIADIDPNNLEEAGWCVIFTSDVDPAVKAALAPLLAYRESQAKRLFKVFEGQSGLVPGDDARKWIERQGASFAVVDPEHGSRSTSCSSDRRIRSRSSSSTSSICIGTSVAYTSIRPTSTAPTLRASSATRRGRRSRTRNGR